MKRCVTCGETKPLEDFHKAPDHSDGRQSECKPCQVKRHRLWRQANPDRVKSYNRKYSQRNRERKRQYRRALHVKHRYGLTVEEHDVLLAEGCAICGTHDGKLCVDHDHETGAIRAALCDRCNLAIGQLGDDPELAYAAAEYLAFWKAPLRAASSL